MIRHALKPLLLLVVIAALIWAGYRLFRPDSHDLVAEAQIEIMQEALLAMESFNENGDASAAVSKLESLTSQYADLLERRKALGDGDDEANKELTAEIEKLSGELVNESLEVDLSEKPKASVVAAAFEKFSSQ